MKDRVAERAQMNDGDWKLGAYGRGNATTIRRVRSLA
jgi:hypothetical protein